MKPRLTRALIVLTVFGLLAVLAATDSCVARTSAPPAPPPGATPPAGRSSFPQVVRPEASPGRAALARVFMNQFRTYVAWALVMPGIFYLARRIPLLGRHRARAVAFHVIVPLVGALPFFFFRFVVNRAFGVPFPPWGQLAAVPWGLIVVMQALTAAPVYWLLIGMGTLVQFSREREASRMAEVELQHSLAVAQLDALKMKLQPHFLFNALNSIAALVRVGETAAVVRTVEHLGTLLRLSMETSARQFVPLNQEMALVDAYLAIEEVRFGDRLRVVRRIAPDARQALVPNLILQPLVENALVHGLSRRLDASLLELAARRDGSLLRIAVRDDGPGLPPAWSLAADAGAGLRNVTDRIEGLFPGVGRLTMENGATGGAVALLSLPFADAETTAMAGERESWTA